LHRDALLQLSLSKTVPRAIGKDVIIGPDIGATHWTPWYHECCFSEDPVDAFPTDEMALKTLTNFLSWQLVTDAALEGIKLQSLLYVRRKVRPTL
jgi:hypothetical protein